MRRTGLAVVICASSAAMFFGATPVAADAPVSITTTISSVDDDASRADIEIRSEVAVTLRARVHAEVPDGVIVSLEPASWGEGRPLAPGRSLNVSIERVSMAMSSDPVLVDVTIEPIAEALPLGYIETVVVPAGEPVSPVAKKWTETIESGRGDTRSLDVVLLNEGSCRGLYFPEGTVGTLTDEQYAIDITARCVERGGVPHARLEIPDGADGRTYTGEIDLSPGVAGGELELTISRRSPIWVPLASILFGTALAYFAGVFLALKIRVGRIRAKVLLSSAHVDGAESEWTEALVATPYACWSISAPVRWLQGLLLARCDEQGGRWALPPSDDPAVAALESDVDVAGKAAKEWVSLAKVLARYDEHDVRHAGLDPFVKLDTIGTVFRDRLDPAKPVAKPVVKPVVKTAADTAERRERASREALATLLEDITVKTRSAREALAIIALWPSRAIRALELDMTGLRYPKALPAWFAFEAAARRAIEIGGVRLALERLDHVLAQVAMQDLADTGSLAPAGSDSITVPEPPPGGFSNEALGDLHGALIESSKTRFFGFIRLAILFALALYGGMATLYIGKIFGGPSDYVAAVAWGLGGGLLASAVQGAMLDLEKFDGERSRILAAVRRAVRR